MARKDVTDKPWTVDQINEYCIMKYPIVHAGIASFLHLFWGGCHSFSQVMNLEVDRTPLGHFGTGSGSRPARRRKRRRTFVHWVRSCSSTQRLCIHIPSQVRYDTLQTIPGTYITVSNTSPYLRRCDWIPRE